ncbi:MAG TPA: ATP-binding protein, partial [Polyangiaceae bacterium]
AGSFNRMVARLRELVKQIQDSAHEEHERLDSLVRLRTSELAARNQAQRLVMDNVEQGFLTIDTDGTMSDERSRAVERWFGAATAGTKLWDYLDRVAKSRGTACALAWDQVIEGFLPIELALDQMPKRIVSGDRHYAVSFRPLLLDGDRFEKALVVITDVTDVVARERSEEDERETVNLLGRLLEDPAWVEEFVEEGRALVERIEARRVGEADFRIAVHTLKGNSSLLGLGAVTRSCEEAETALANGEPFEHIDTMPIVGAFARVEGKLLRFRRAFEVGAGQSLNEGARAELLRAITSRAPHAELEVLVRSFALEPVELRLRRAAEQVRALAARLGKGPVSVKVECDRLRAERSDWQALWLEIPHLLRNAVDHGLERPDQRVAHGKPVEATVFLRARSLPEGMVVEVEDQGTGIDWARIEKKARELGLVRGEAVTTAALTESLFSQGLTTAEGASETSGRGVGLSAVRDAVARRGGRISVETRPGCGTKFSLVWPSRSIHVERFPSPVSELSSC